MVNSSVKKTPGIRNSFEIESCYVAVVSYSISEWRTRGAERLCGDGRLFGARRI